MHDRPDPSPSEPTTRKPAPHSLARSFYFAFAGIAHLLRTQRNARIELLIGIAACGLALWLRIAATQWAILALTICAVLILESLNTAMEAVVDLASPEQHRLAKIAKDVSAGAVLIAAIGAVVVGVMVLGPALWRRIGF